MRRSFTCSLIALAAVLALASSALAQKKAPAKPAAKAPARAAAKPAEKPPARPATEFKVPFQVGETLTYDVSWSSYVTAGTVVTTVKEKKASNGSTAYYMMAEARPTAIVSKIYPLYYKFDTFLDAFTLLPQRGSAYNEEGKRHRYGITRFDRGAKKVFWEYQTTTTVKSEFTVAPDVQDALSAIYVLRAIPLKPGDRLTMPVSDNGEVFKVAVTVGPAETIRTPAGDFKAIKVSPAITDSKGVAQGRNIAFWLSDDARRVPVKFVAELAVGSFTVVLREAK